MTFQSARAISLPVALATVIAQRRFIAVNSSGEAVQAGVNADAVGVSLEASSSSQDGSIPVAVLDGAVLEVEAGGTVTQGGPVESDADGRAVDAAGGGSLVLATALDAGVLGQIIRVVAQPRPGVV